MSLREETIQVSGIRCERCVMRLAKVLEAHAGLEAANANLMGQVSLAWDDERTSREAILAEMARGGFRELETKGQTLRPGGARLASSTACSSSASGSSGSFSRIWARCSSTSFEWSATVVSVPRNAEAQADV